MSATMQTRNDLEAKQQRKEHWALVKAQLVDIWSTKFGTKIIQENEASIKAVIEMCAEYSSTPFNDCVPSAATMKEIYRYNYDYFRQRLGSLLIEPGVVRENLIQEIIFAHNVGRARLGREPLSDFEKAQLLAQLRNGFTLQALKNRLSQVLVSQRLLGKSKVEVEAFRDAARKADEPLPQQIPAEYTPKVLREKLYQWSKSKTDWFINQYGEAAVNARLNGTDGFVEAQNP